jgi:glycosyltransferase involved in cell wall biosynthesis
MHAMISVGALTVGGIGRNTISLASGLTEKGCKVTLVLAPAGGALESEIPAGVSVIRCSGGARELIRRSSALYRGRVCDVVISARQHISFATEVALRLARVRSKVVHIATVRTLMSEQWRTSGPKYRMIGLAARWAYKHADAVICISDAVRVDLANRLGCAQTLLHTVPNPALPPSREIQEAIDRTRSGTNREVEEKRVLFLGRLAYEKRPNLFLDVIERCRHLPVRGVIAGGGPMEGSLRERIEKDSLPVEMCGYSSHPLETIASADLLLVTSKWEGFGNVIVESLALGVPVIAVDAGGGGPRSILGPVYAQALVDDDCDAIVYALEAWVSGLIWEPSDLLCAKAAMGAYSRCAIASRYLEITRHLLK